MLTITFTNEEAKQIYDMAGRLVDACYKAADYHVIQILYDRMCAAITEREYREREDRERECLTDYQNCDIL